MRVFLDTDILIDVQRNRPNAIAWLTQNQSLEAAVPGVVALELLQGSRTQLELKKSERFLRDFEIVDHNEMDFLLSRKLLISHHIPPALSLADFLVAATALNRDATIYTFNIRHYSRIKGLKCAAPYVKDP